MSRLWVCGLLGAMALQLTPPAPQRVLFIGNSLTQANGLGAMVEALARQAGGVPIESRTVAHSGYSLEDHWQRGEARRILREGRWTLVVLQQGPSTQPDSERLLREYVRQFDGEAARAGTRTAIFMTWPPRAGPGTFADSSRAYRHSNDDVGGVLLPVGDAFRVALERDGAVPLLGADGFHPSPLGSYLAAIVIYRALSGRPEPFVPSSLAAHGEQFPVVSTPDATLTLLKAAAAAVH